MEVAQGSWAAQGSCAPGPKADDCRAAGIGTVHGGQLSILDVSLTTKASCRV